MSTLTIVIPQQLSLLLYSVFELHVSAGLVKSELLCVHSKSQETVSKKGVLEETVMLLDLWLQDLGFALKESQV